VTGACAICERPIANMPEGAPDVLCPLCAAQPLLVRAFTEREARRRASSSEAEAARPADA
jgi:hypothetical protein